MKIILSALLLGLCVSVLAAPPTVLTWDTCVQEAAENNPELRSARASLEAAVFSAEGAYSGFLP